jgi:putative nucleotidyltransferase with HDIG domain
MRALAFVLGASTAASVAAALTADGLGNVLVVAALCLVTAVAEGRSIRVSRGIELSVSFIPVSFAAVLFGPGAGAVVGLASMAGDLRGPVERFVIFASARGLAGLAAGVAAAAARDLVPGQDVEHYLTACAAAALAGGAVDFLVSAVVSLLRRIGTPRDLWRLVRGSIVVSVALYTPLTALFAYAYALGGYSILPFFLIPLLAAHLSHSMYSRQKQLIDELSETNEQLEDANAHLRRINLSFAAAMVRALDSRDAYTAGHSAAVAIYSRDIARELGMDARSVELIHLAGLVHDIGKIGLRAEVLQKTSALDDVEWAEMRRHSEIGARILEEVKDYADVADIVRSHHERVDGAGYPDGLAGEEIPILSRIIAVADSYNAMTSTRPYRKAMEPEVAVNQLLLGRGSQFEPALVDAFVAILQRESEPYRRGLLVDFSLEAMQHQALAPAPTPLRAMPGTVAA